MSNHLNVVVIILFVIFIFLTSLLFVVLRRYKTFNVNNHVLFFRNGLLKTEKLGGGYFLLPFIDKVIALPVGYQRVDFTAQEQIVFKPKFREEEIIKKIDLVKINGFLMYKITDPVQFFKLSGKNEIVSSQTNIGYDYVKSTSKDIRDTIESFLKSVILEEAMDDLYRNRIDLRNLINQHLEENFSIYGIKFMVIRISSVQFEGN